MMNKELNRDQILFVISIKCDWFRVRDNACKKLVPSRHVLDVGTQGFRGLSAPRGFHLQRPELIQLLARY
jgi:hypothetical protein